MKSLGVLCVLLVFVLLFSFTTEEKIDYGSKIKLRFTKNYPEEKIESKKTGLLWALSFLGADLPKGCFKNALKKQDSVIYVLDVSKVGFNEKAVNALKKIIESLKESEEYKVAGGIEVGEFIMYTLGSSWHYYEITGASKTFQEYRSIHSDFKMLFPVTNSMVAAHQRLLQFSDFKKVQENSYFALEGEGSLADGTFIASVTEVMDLMPNGQLRFAVYGKEGELLDASPRSSGLAGKPLKCLWCHEINIQTLFSKNDSVGNFISPETFKNTIAKQKQLLDKYRAGLKSEINFNNKQDHALMELLYISFMQPSAYKLSKEWGEEQTQLGEKFKGLKTHDHFEHKFLKQLYHRADITKFAPYKTVALPDSTLEQGGFEPNVFIKK